MRVFLEHMIGKVTHFKKFSFYFTERKWFQSLSMTSPVALEHCEEYPLDVE